MALSGISPRGLFLFVTPTCMEVMVVLALFVVGLPDSMVAQKVVD